MPIFTSCEFIHLIYSTKCAANAAGFEDTSATRRGGQFATNNGGRFLCAGTVTDCRRNRSCLATHECGLCRQRATNGRPYILVGSADYGCTIAPLVQREVGCRLRIARHYNSAMQILFPPRSRNRADAIDVSVEALKRTAPAAGSVAHTVLSAASIPCSRNICIRRCVKAGSKKLGNTRCVSEFFDV